ncbi:MAG: hypothetical protein ABIV06_10425 [Thermoanaerobaculia bacterium]
MRPIPGPFEFPPQCLRSTALAIVLLGVVTLRPVYGGDLLEIAGAAVAPGAPKVSRCAPVEVRTTHGGKMLPHTRLARIENGRVPCMHVEDGTVASCLFSTAGEAASGSWLDGPEGGFAQIGQAVSLDGKPGGEYIVAARVNADNSVSCTEPTGMDTAGWLAEGVDLAPSCILEELGSEWNLLSSYGWAPLWNVSNHEVCFGNDPASHPHPDGPDPVRSYALAGSPVDNVFCYLGSAAALNDINGMERDETGNYYSGEGYCHMIVSSGFEVPGAKRPSTRSLPAPGIVRVTSFITWKPVNPNVAIANW